MTNSNVNKIQKALKIIKQLLPKTYEIPDVKIYKTVYSMLRAQAKETGKTYEQMKQYYNDSLTVGTDMQNNKYIDTKYYQPSLLSRDTKEECFRITALASNPIKINLQNTETDTLAETIFLLLHEIGHIYYNKKGKEKNEYFADKFAIRWIKKYLRTNKGE